MKRKKFGLIFLALVSLLSLLAIAVLLNVITLDELPSSFIGAVFGAAITGVITLILLKGQTESQEVKERNVCVFSKRSEIFQKYIKDVWEIWEKQKITSEIFKNLTLGYYRDLMIYLDDEIKYEGDKRNPSIIIADCLSDIGNCLDKNDYNTYEKLRKNVTLISNVLSSQIELGGKIEENIITKHDEQMWPIYFRKELLDAFNNMSQVKDGILERGIWVQGKSRIMRNGDKYEPRWIHDAIIFKFSKYPAFSIQFENILNTKHGTSYGLNKMGFGPKLKMYRNGKSELINISEGLIDNLFAYITPEEDELKIPPFSLSYLDHPFYKAEKDNLEKIRKEYQMTEIAETLAERASKVFDNLKIGNEKLPILEYMEKINFKSIL